MPEPKTLKPAHKAVKSYYASLQSFKDQHVDHEMAVWSAFQTLLNDAARLRGWVLVPELSDKNVKGLPADFGS